MQELFRKYLDNQCSPVEVAELLQYFGLPESEHLLRKLVRESLERQEEMPAGEESRWNEVTTTAFEGIKKQMDAGKKKAVPLFRKTWFRVAAAAVFLLGMVAIYKLAEKKNPGTSGLVKKTREKQDIAPGGDKAVLTLADGSTIILDSALNGDLTSQGNTKVIKLNGQLAYTAAGKTSEVLYNTITTPRGGQYRLVLADGSRVWLNAASSFRFPANFTGSERNVELTGEGYFEVAKNASMPFKVKINTPSGYGGEVEVLGTHFNINAYSDEPAIQTTLLEGKVKVNAFSKQPTVTSNTQLLFPGQQALVSTTGQIVINKHPDIEEVMAWKNGKFIFHNADIHSIMRQIQRWYDVEVSFSGTITSEEFEGVIPSNVNISQILNMLEKTGAVRFEVEGKKVIVK